MRFLLFINFFIFIGCSVHDIDTEPQKKIEIPSGYSFSSDAFEQKSISSFWYEEFKDEKLLSLIAYAYENNYDINQSIARVKAARAISRSSSVASYPELSLDVDINREFKERENSHSARAGVALNWEIDLFNKLENSAKSDFLETEALKEDLEALKLSLGSEIVVAYFGSLQAQETLALLQKQLELNSHYLKLLNMRFEHGIATNLEVLQQKAQVEESRSLIPLALASLHSHENKLDILLGKSPDNKIRVDRDNSVLNISLPSNIGLPSELLLFRPDLRAQLKRLIASDADIAVAIADRIPSLSLGVGGYYLDSSGYRGGLVSLGASLFQPLLDWGARKAEVERNRALYEEDLALFSSLYLKALEEVESAIYSEKKQVEYIEALKKREEIEESSLKEAQLQYLEGLSDYLTVIDSLVNLHKAQRSLIEAKYDLILFRVTLHRALGTRVREIKDNQ